MSFTEEPFSYLECTQSFSGTFFLLLFTRLIPMYPSGLSSREEPRSWGCCSKGPERLCFQWAPSRARAAGPPTPFGGMGGGALTSGNTSLSSVPSHVPRPAQRHTLPALAQGVACWAPGSAPTAAHPQTPEVGSATARRRAEPVALMSCCRRVYRCVQSKVQHRPVQASSARSGLELKLEGAGSFETMDPLKAAATQMV